MRRRAETRTRRPAPPADARGRGIAAAGLAASLLLVAGLAAGLPAGPVAALHVLVCLAVAILIARARGDRAVASVIGLAALTLGPAGLLASAVAMHVAARREADPSLRGWHEQIMRRQATDPAEALYRDIVEGRAFASATVPASFSGVMSGRDVGRRQRLLGMLAKQGGPVPQALLEAGLAAPELAVRAPAAAVVARLRERQREAAR